MASIHHLEWPTEPRAGSRPARAGRAIVYPFPTTHVARMRLLHTNQGQAHLVRLYLDGADLDVLAARLYWPGSVLRRAILRFTNRHLPGRQWPSTQGFSVLTADQGLAEYERGRR